MNYIRDNDIVLKSINGQYYKIFVNLDKNKLPLLVKYIEEHNKSEWKLYFEKEFELAFISFKTFLCEKN